MEYTLIDMKRDQLPDLLKQHNLLDLGAEIGVWQGHYSSHILNNWPGKIILVDWWKGHSYDELGGRDVRNEPQHIVDRYYYATLDRMRQFPEDRYRILRMDSVEAAEHVQDGSLDWVYIDANHTYQGCTRDLEAWYPKVKPGGLVSGHDFVEGDNLSGTDFRVQSAVMDFMAITCHRSKLFVMQEDWPSWYWFKEKGNE